MKMFLNYMNLAWAILERPLTHFYCQLDLINAHFLQPCLINNTPELRGVDTAVKQWKK